jgi:hypothetical protein
MESGGGERAGRVRSIGSVALLALAWAALLLGSLTLYARSHIFNADRFSDEAAGALEDSDVRSAVAVQITDDVIDKAAPDLVTLKPIVEAAVGALIGTDPFETAFRRGVRAAHRAVFDRERDDALVVLTDIGVLVREGVASFDPKLARRIPSGFDEKLLRLESGGVATDAAQIADRVRALGIVLPILGLLLLAASVAIAPERRHAITRAGVAIGVLGLSMAIVWHVGRSLFEGSIDNQVDSRAAGSIWDAFLAPLRTWYLVLAGVGLVAASAAASLLRPIDLDEPLRRAWRWVSRQPETALGRVLWATALAAAGLVMVLDPGLVLRLAVVVAGAYVISRALAVLIGVVSVPEQERRAATTAPRRGPRRGMAPAAAALAILASVIGVAALVAGGEDSGDENAPAAVRACNGSAKLCDRHLDEVVLAATHNSYAGADYRGFLFPEQEGTIEAQLEAGVRGLWIDTYYGLPGRRVYTETDRIDPALHAQLKQELGPKFTAAADQIRSEIARPRDESPRIFLCHGYCELGAVDAEEAFEQIAKFLGDHPGEVLIIDLEDYTTPAETAALIESTGLSDYVYKGPAGPPWPTLRQMISSGGRVLIGAEHRTEGAPSWYRRIYSYFQETPFAFKTPAQMSCAPDRGSSRNSFFLINNWIDTDPTPKPSNAAKVNAYDFLLDRARRCQRKRGRLPNALNVDFYGEGDVFGVVATLNRLKEGRGG